MFLRMCALIVGLILTPVALAHTGSSTLAQNINWYKGSAWPNDIPYKKYISDLESVESFGLTGGEYVSVVTFYVDIYGKYVVDFSNSALIGEFKHHLFTSDSRLVAMIQGGLSHSEQTEFFLRNGRTLELSPGHYTLVSYQNSQFNIAPPTPFIMSKQQYVQEIRMGNTVTLLGLGIFSSLFIYYIVLSIVRSSLVEFTYALFILGNLLFNGTSLLVIKQIFGFDWFWGASWPIFFSNIAYVFFVTSLLGISKKSSFPLWFIRNGIFIVFLVFLFSAPFIPHWQNEMNRVAVGIFMAFGLVAGVWMSFKGSMIARLYLLANIGFVVLGAIAISQEEISGLQTIYMSHIGLIAVAIEVLLLSSVVAYQMVLLEGEKTQALNQAKRMLKIAQTDSLTGLPNRYAMDKHLLEVNDEEAFIFIDLDGLKYCNDTFGHDVGDKFLLMFSRRTMDSLPTSACLYRISGDEFGIIISNTELQVLMDELSKIENEMRGQFSRSVGVSFGVAKFKHHTKHQAALRAADEDMYVHKKRKKALLA
ncbi:sensor domain-containing diguanylate cyclase [Vibrio intestinalis]|uniref:sensor domain-containing diguanylate cyclase n=1 Tax=Vibrio intestinalis TaxID=2933291 RepID=UPI0021A5F3E7|nr:diguanylate cyclase [Vibrio intestinalis]